MDKDQLDERYELVERLTKLFRFERYVYLVISVLSLIILLGTFFWMISKGAVDSSKLSLMFGSSGLVTYTGGQLLRMWNQALKVIITGKL
jgi:hypothetical protein